MARTDGWTDQRTNRPLKEMPVASYNKSDGTTTRHPVIHDFPNHFPHGFAQESHKIGFFDGRTGEIISQTKSSLLAIALEIERLM